MEATQITNIWNAKEILQNSTVFHKSAITRCDLFSKTLKVSKKSIWRINVKKFAQNFKNKKLETQYCEKLQKTQ